MNSDTSTQSCRIINEPWLESPNEGTLIAAGGRPHFLTPVTVDRISVYGAGTSLPCLGNVPTTDGLIWRKWELPTTAVSVESGGPADEIIQLHLFSNSESSEMVEIHLTGCIPRPISSEEDTQPKIYDTWGRAGEDSSVLLGQHIETLAEVYDSSSSADDWSGPAEGLAVGPWSQFMETWRENRKADEPRRALIVRIANEIGPTLQSVCRRPRKVLHRIRQFERPERIRQIDAACMRWLVRQPGRTMAERAGAKQRLMGVVRVDHADTPENRVVRDFIIRAKLACYTYSFENQNRKTAQRVVEIQRFRHLLEKQMRTTDIGHVRQLVGSAEPNYVLLYDQRYHSLWLWYLKLRKQQTEQDDAWRWRHRTWAEMCLLAVGACLDDHQVQHPNIANLGYKSTIYIRSEQSDGQFIDTRSPLGPWVVRHRSGVRFVDLIRGDQLAHVAGQDHRLALLQNLSPDFVLVSHPPYSDFVDGEIMAIWTMLDYCLTNANLQDRLDSLHSVLSRQAQSSRINGMILLPLSPSKSNNEPLLAVNNKGSSFCMGFAFQGLTQNLDWLILGLEDLLHIKAL